MTTNLGAITFSCQHPHKVAEFWAHALGRHIAATADSGSAAILAVIPLYFRRSTSETTVENYIHLDLTTDDLDADATRLRELGATGVRRDEWHSTKSITFLDVEGNQFDLIAE
jgi:hypothetical protein